jgi:anti-anti-sigma factor
MPELVRVNFEMRDGTSVAHIVGEIDLSNIAVVRDLLEAHLDAADRHVVDLTGTTYLDSAGVGLLFALVERHEARGQRIEIVVPPTSPIHRLLGFTDLPGRVTVRDRLDAAFDGA